MITYHKIDTIFKRDPDTKFRTLILGDYAQDVFSFLAENDWVFTEKVDGTNIRVMINGDGISFGGKTDAATIPAFLARRLEERFLPQRDALQKTFPNGGCLYGEGYGAKIHNGGSYRADQDFVLFDIKVGDCWLQRSEVEDVAAKFALDVVPVIDHGTLSDMVDLVRAGFNSKWGSFMAEGVVARPAVELRTWSGARVITKLKHKDFWMEHTPLLTFSHQRNC